MKPTIIAQKAVIIALAFIGFAALIAVPSDTNPNWVSSLLFSKLLAAAALYGAYRLNQVWDNKSTKVL